MGLYFCLLYRVAFLGYPSLTVYVVCGRKATLNLNYFLLRELKIKIHLCSVQIQITNPVTQYFPLFCSKL